MQVNYVREHERFIEYAADEKIPANAQLLWYALMHIFNQRAEGSEWPDGFIRINNDRLFMFLPIKWDAMAKARNALKQAGLIDFRNGNRNKSAPEYRLIPFYPLKTDNTGGNTGGNVWGNTGGNEEGKRGDFNININDNKQGYEEEDEDEEIKDNDDARARISHRPIMQRGRPVAVFGADGRAGDTCCRRPGGRKPGRLCFDGAGRLAEGRRSAAAPGGRIPGGVSAGKRKMRAFRNG